MVNVGYSNSRAEAELGHTGYALRTVILRIRTEFELCRRLQLAVAQPLRASSPHGALVDGNRNADSVGDNERASLTAVEHDSQSNK